MAVRRKTTTRKKTKKKTRQAGAASKTTAAKTSAAGKVKVTSKTAPEVSVESRLLAPLAEHGISMTRIESRPSRQGNWDYVFFIDIEGHQDDPSVAAALKELQRQSRMLKLLGSYPNAVL